MSSPIQEIESALILNFISSLGIKDIQSLFQQYGSSCEAIKQIQEWTIKIAPTDLEQAAIKAEKEIKLLEKHAIRIFLLSDEDYPPLLKQISCPPLALFIKGTTDWTSPALALVGSRRCTYYGGKVARQLSRGLAEAGIVTVSGLARGIDSLVHESTLEAEGKTWAVLGHGLSWLYPPDNKQLAHRIEKSGALISEFPFETRPFPGNFPRRNRIIAGLCSATIVIEGKENSGSLITARLAAQEGRDVMAVPGPISSPLSEASHRLIQNGALLIHTVEDILMALPELKTNLSMMVEKVKQKNERSEIPTDIKPILEILSDIPMSKETLAEQLKIQASTLVPQLMKMELKGWIKSLPGGLLVKGN